MRNHKRLLRESKTIEKMIEMYCRDNHLSETQLCETCFEINEYAHLRLEKCRYQDKKPTCAKCPTHCYKKSMREAVRLVMRYAGPRMLTKHPLMAIMHLLDGLRPNPAVRNK